MLICTGVISSSGNFLKLVIFIFFQIIRVTATGVCSEEVFGRPQRQSCERALSTFPRDPFLRYFVEQQLRPMPNHNWLSFHDTRPGEQQPEIVQVPKLWGACL